MDKKIVRTFLGKQKHAGKFFKAMPRISEGSATVWRKRKYNYF